MDNIGNIFYFDWELDLLHWFQSIHNDVLDWIVPKVTSLGNAGWFWIVVILLLLILSNNNLTFSLSLIKFSSFIIFKISIKFFCCLLIMGQR